MKNEHATKSHATPSKNDATHDDPEPAIISFGRSLIKDYPEQEFRDSFLRAFGGPDPADFIVLDSNPWGQRFLAAGAAWAIDKGYLYCDRCQTGDQEQVATFRLTEQGKIEFKLNK